MDAKEVRPPEIPIYCDARDMAYWFRVGNRFLKMGAKDVRMHLTVKHGLSKHVYYKGICQTDWPLYEAQEKRIVDYAGPLAGHKVGIYKNSSGGNFLVTQQVEVATKKDPKEPKFFKPFVEELLPDGQSEYFLYWLKIALASLVAGDFRPGQVVVLAGPSECGKSLLQFIITEILGGREANPFSYMMGEKFNYDLGGAEHWCIADPATTTDIRARRFFGAKLKEATVNSQISINQKGKDALLLTIFRRVTISVNDEPENLAVIPPLDDSIRDKIFVLKCKKVVETLTSFMVKGELDRNKLRDAIRAELPVMRSWLLSLPALPRSLRNVRFGIQSWQHPELMAALSDLAPESRLLSLLDEVLWLEEEQSGDFEGRAIDIERTLRNSKFSFEADKILKFNGACGTYLARLAKQYPQRISKRLNTGHAFWIITRPANQKNNNANI